MLKMLDTEVEAGEGFTREVPAIWEALRTTGLGWDIFFYFRIMIFRGAR